MRGFITVNCNRSPIHIAVDSIRSFTVVDRYHPNQNARITLKDGEVITTDWDDNVESIAKKIVESNNS